MQRKKTMVMTIAVLISLFMVAPVAANTFPSLPSTPVTLQISPGPTPVVVTLSDVPAGFDVTNSPPTYVGWCVQLNVNINYGQSYSVMLISSLGLPTPWDKINYLLNNKDGTATGEDINVAIWLLLGYSTTEIEARGFTVTTVGTDMYNDANTNGGGFIPTAGQLVAVKCDAGEGVQDIFIELEIPGEYEGLTPGFWKTHPELWTGYSTSQTFYDVFGVYITINAKGGNPGIFNPTLIEAIGAQGGVNEGKVPAVYDALARHAVAALLNAAHPDVTYPMSETEIIDAVAEAIGNADLTDAEPLKNALDMYNNAGGGIDAHGNPI